MQTSKHSPLSSVWSGPSLAHLRTVEDEIARLRRIEPELVDACQHWQTKGEELMYAMERLTLDNVRAKASTLEEKLAAHATRAARNGLVILDDAFALSVKRHGEYLLLAAPDSVLGRLTGERWRGIEICEWVDPTHETITESWAVIVAREPAQVSPPEPEPEISIVAYRERESRAEAGVILRHEYRVRTCEDVGEDALARALGQAWWYYHGDSTHVLEERAYRDGVPQTVWTITASFEGYERTVEHIDTGVTFVCPVLRETHERQERERHARAAARAAEQAAAERAANEQADREWHAARSQAAFDRLSWSKDGVWAERWNAFTSAATPADIERLRADARAVELHDAVIAAETVPAKRKAIKAFLAYVE